MLFLLLLTLIHNKNPIHIMLNFRKILREDALAYKNSSVETPYSSKLVGPYNREFYITALLNLYHEIRGSEYRHNFPSTGYHGILYQKAYQKWKTLHEQPEEIS